MIKLNNNFLRKGFPLWMLLMLCLFGSTSAQEKQEEVTLIRPTYFGISPSVRDLALKNPVDENYIHIKEESPDKEHRKPQEFPLAKVDDPVYGNDEQNIQKDMGAVQAGQTRLNIAGQVPGGGFRPYDPSGAVGPNHYVQMINSTTFRVYDKTGTVLATTTLGNLWSPATPNAGDPIVMYDKAADRWFLAQFGSGNQVYIAISTSPNPMGTYFTYTYISPLFPDYLKFGIWHDAYYMTSNQSPVRVFAFNRSELLAGTPGARSISLTYSPPKPGGFWLPLPADAGDGTLPPTTAPCPIISFEDNGWGGTFNDEVNIYNMSVNWVPVTPTATITLGATLPAAAFDAYYDPGWNDVSQPGTAQKLDGIGGVLQYRAQWKSWTGYNSVVLNWPVRISATQRSLKWMELRQNQSSGVWSVFQEGIYSPDADTRWMGSICMDNNGSIGLSYMKSNSTTLFPGLYYTGRRTCDPLGTLPVAEQLVVAGTGSQTSGNRNGDYAQTVLDVDGVTFWSTSEFMGGPSGSTAARTRIFSYQISPCNLPVSCSIAITSGTNPTCGNQLVTFTATPTNGGTAPSYQWQVNGVNVGFNSPVYSTTSLVSGQTVTCILTSNAPGAIGNPATSNAIIMTVNPVPTIGAGAVTSSLTTLCEGTSFSLSYNGPACATANGFAGFYAPANWTLTQSNSNGSVNSASAPANISLISSNGLGGAGTTSYSITIPCSGNVTFNWSYSTTDGALYDYPRYSINGGTPQFFTGYSTGGANTQSGTQTIAVNAGDVLSLDAYSVDNFAGACTIVISNFTGPYTPSTSVSWHTALTGGSLVNFGSPATFNLSSGIYQYFAELTDNLSGCTALSRVASPIITVDPKPQGGAVSMTAPVICLDNSNTLTYTPPCAAISGFATDYDPTNWTTTLVNSNGNVNATAAPGSIVLTSSNNLSGTPGETNYTVTVPCAGVISFNWSFTTVDGPIWEHPRYTVNGGTYKLMNGFNTLGSVSQNGSQSISVAAGQTITLQAYCTDNFGGNSTVTISGFAFNPDKLITWYTTPVAGTSIGTSNPQTYTPASVGTYYYYAELEDPLTGCINTNRIRSNGSIVYGVTAVGTASASPNPVCVGSPLALTYTPPACLPHIGFNNGYGSSNWTLTNTNSNGSVVTANTPFAVSLISSDGLTGQGFTDYTITVPCAGNVSFNWYYTTVDGAYYDVPRYSVNGGAFQVFSGYNQFGTNVQYGTETIAVGAGQTITLQAYSLDNVAGSCTIEISDWKAPSNDAQLVAWYDAPTGGTFVGTGTTFTTTPAVVGSQTYYAQVYDDYTFCTTLPRIATNSVQVNALPTPGILPATATICAGQSVSLTANGGVSYSWMPGSLSGATVSVSPATTTIYTVSVTNANGCVATTTRIVTVNPLPTGGVANASPAAICLGSTVNLTYNPPSGPLCNGGTQSGFASYYAPANWALSQFNSNGSVNTASAPASITLVSSNNLSITSGTTNYEITIPCTGVVSFNWSYTTLDGPQYDYPRYSINGGTPVIFPGYLTNGSIAQTGSFSLLLTAGQTLNLQSYSVDNVSGSCSVVITAFVAPTSSVSNQTVTWHSAATGGTLLGSTNPLTVTPATAGNFTYYAQVTETTTGCTNSVRVASNPVAVNALPNVTTSTSASSICLGGSATLTGSGANTYTWMPGSLTGVSVVVSPATTTTYTVTGTNTATGCTNTATRTITVNTLPSVGTTTTAGTICAGASSSITGTGANTYTWMPGSLTGTTITVTPGSTTTYTVTGTNTATGCTNTATRTITVNTLPSVGTTTTAGTICAGASSSITGTGANTYTWMPGSLTGTTITVTPGSTTTYTVTGTNTATGCVNTATRTITVNALPSVGTTTTAGTICAGASSSITGTGANTYTWMPGSLTGTTVTVTPGSTTTYTVTGTNTATGCVNTATRTITVNPQPNVTTTTTNASICAGASTSISASGANTYTWMPGSLSGATITVSPASTTTYTVTGTTTATGCTKTATRTITVTPCGSVVNVKLFIEGFMVSNSSMTPVLFNQGVSGSTTITDDITVQIRNATAPYALVASTNTTVNTSGNAVCNFSSLGTGNYYIVVIHRNAVQTWSANPVSIAGGGTTSYDFTNAANKAFGNNMVQIAPGSFAFFSGDVNQDGAIDAFDYILMDPDIVNGNSGYLVSDLNGDGSADAFDYLVAEPNITNGIGSSTP